MTISVQLEDTTESGEDRAATPFYAGIIPSKCIQWVVKIKKLNEGWVGWDEDRVIGGGFFYFF